MNNKLGFNLFIPFQKKDGEEKIVEGYASSEALDSQGEIIKASAIEAALPDYMKFANIREMHVHSAVGKALSAQMDPAKKALYLVCKVVDPVAWEKVKEGVYNGFSIGGRVVKRVGNTIHELTLHEISLVDRPANPEALFSVYKADSPDGGSVTEDGMYMPPHMNIYLSGQILSLAMELCSLYDLYEMTGKKTDKVEEAIQAVTLLAEEQLTEDDAKKVEDAMAMTKKKISSKERGKLPKSSFAYVDKDGNGHLPIHDEAHVRNAIARFGQTDFESPDAKKKAAAKIIRAARRYGIVVKPDSAVSEAAKKYEKMAATDRTLWVDDYFKDLRKYL